MGSLLVRIGAWGRLFIMAMRSSSGMVCERDRGGVGVGAGSGSVVRMMGASVLMGDAGSDGMAWGAWDVGACVGEVMVGGDLL